MGVRGTWLAERSNKQSVEVATNFVFSDNSKAVTYSSDVRTVDWCIPIKEMYV
jgi:hypothetical protein